MFWELGWGTPIQFGKYGQMLKLGWEHRTKFSDVCVSPTPHILYEGILLDFQTGGEGGEPHRKKRKKGKKKLTSGGGVGGPV